MDQLLDHLYLGSFEDAQTWPVAHMVLNIAERPYARERMVHLPIADEVFHPPLIWQGLVGILALLLHQGDTVLIHCRLGVSRSPALCAAYLAYTGWDLDEALGYVASKRACVKVHEETLRGVVEWHKHKL